MPFLCALLLANLKGLNNANPRVVVNFCKKGTEQSSPPIDRLFSGLGPANTQAFSVSVGKSCWIDTTSQVIDTVIYDDDYPGDGAKLFAENWVNADFSKSGSSQFSFADGSTITIYYTSY